MVSLPELSVRRPVAVLMLTLIVATVGAFCFTRLGFDLMPNLTYPAISVVCTCEGMAPEEMERLITKPIEEVLSTVKGARRIRSVTREGVSVITVEFSWGTNLDFAAQDVREKVASIEDALPEEMDRPFIAEYDPTMTPLMFFGVVGRLDPYRLREISEDVIKPRLERVEGVAAVVVLGGWRREIVVEADAEKLERFGVPLSRLVEAIRARSAEVSGGHVERGREELLVRPAGAELTPEEIAKTPVAAPGGSVVRVGDVAKVYETHPEERAKSRINLKPAVLLMVLKEPEANTVRAADRVRRAAREIARRLPEVRLVNLMDPGRFIKATIKRIGSSIAIGSLLAVLVLLYLLRDFRPTLAISIAIPLSLLAAFIPLYFAGQTLNMMTLGGLGLGAGMMVDCAIVVVENIYRRYLEEGEDPITASCRGAEEVWGAITASTLTSVAVFLPLIFVRGGIGQLARPLALAITSSLLASLFVAVTVVPMLTSRILLAFKAKRAPELPLSGLRERLEGTLGRLLRRRHLVGLSALGAVAMGGLLASQMGREFIPSMDTGMVFGLVRLPPGTPLWETDSVCLKIERAFEAQPERRAVGAFVGLSEATKWDLAFGSGPSGPHEAEFMVTFVPRGRRKRRTQEIVEAVRPRLPRLPPGALEFIPIEKSVALGGGRIYPVEVRVFGMDLSAMKGVAERVADICRRVRGTRDVRVSIEEGRPELRVEVDEQEAALRGVTLHQISRALRTALRGEVATRVRRGGRELDVRVRLEPADRESVEALGRLPIPALSGGLVPLRDVARFRLSRGPVAITREDKQRVITVTANVSGRDLGAVWRDIRERLRGLRLPPGVWIEYGGELEKMAKTFKDMAIVLAVSVVLVYMIMAAQFESLLHPVAVMASVPLAAIGVTVLLALCGITWSVASLVGCVILVGVVVNDAIVLVDFTNQLRRLQGMPLLKAIVKAAGVRLRPVISTTATTVLGVLPMALSRQEGVEIRAPMALAIIGGLLSATILTLIVVPVAYASLELLRARFASKRPHPEEAPANPPEGREASPRP